MQTYAALSKLLLQLSLPLGLLISLCLLVARLRQPGASGQFTIYMVPLLLLMIGLQALLGRWLWQAAQSGPILSCGDAGCLRSLVPLADNATTFWLTALVYWLGFVVAPVVGLLPILRWLRHRSERHPPYLDTEPI